MAVLANRPSDATTDLRLCIRFYASQILRDQPDWNLERVKQAMQNGRDNLRVNLSKPLPVLFVYTTVTAGENGDISFYNDVYGYDADQLKALARGYPIQKKPRSVAKGNDAKVCSWIYTLPQ